VIAVGVVLTSYKLKSCRITFATATVLFKFICWPPLKLQHCGRLETSGWLSLLSKLSRLFGGVNSFLCTSQDSFFKVCPDCRLSNNNNNNNKNENNVDDCADYSCYSSDDGGVLRECVGGSIPAWNICKWNRPVSDSSVCAVCQYKTCSEYSCASRLCHVIN